MKDNGSDRLAAVEAALVAVQSAVQNVVSLVGEMSTAFQHQAETTARGFEALTEVMRTMDGRLSALGARMAALDGHMSVFDGRLSVLDSALDARMVFLEARMAEIVRELRTHSHKAA
jgi:hypothetical protein